MNSIMGMSQPMAKNVLGSKQQGQLKLHVDFCLKQ